MTKWLATLFIYMCACAAAFGQESVATRPGTLTLAPGLAATPGSYNPGTQTIVGGAGNLSMQAFPDTHATSCTLNSTCGAADDSGKILIATGAAVVFTAPNPAAGTKGRTFSFGSDGTNSYSITTVGGTATFYGCSSAGTVATTLVEPTNVTVVISDDGTNYACTVMGDRNVTVPLSWGPGQNLSAAAIPIAISALARTILNITCEAEVLASAGSTADLDFRYAASGTAIGGGTLINSTPFHAGSGGTALAQTSLTISNRNMPLNYRLGLVATGAGWASSVGSGVCTFTVY